MAMASSRPTMRLAASIAFESRGGRPSTDVRIGSNNMRPDDVSTEFRRTFAPGGKFSESKLMAVIWLSTPDRTRL